MSHKKKKNKNNNNNEMSQPDLSQFKKYIGKGDKDLPIPEPDLTVRKNIVNTSEHPPSCTAIIIDNFYNNPMQTRMQVLQQDFRIRGNYPGPRTVSFATPELRDIIQRYVRPFGGKITMFPMEKHDKNYNGAFQLTTSRDRSWFHVDSWNNWAGVLYLTPNAPPSGGTGLYRFEDGTRFDFEQKIRNNEDKINNATTDFTKWDLIDQIGNVFNRLVLFNAHHFHSSMDYFGSNPGDGRLFQVFFFSTEREFC